MSANLSANPVPAVALPRELELLRALVDTVPDPLFCKDREGRFLLTNQANAATFGLRPEDFIGKTDAELPGVCHNAEIYRAADARVICTGQPLQMTRASAAR
jgi:PAS domain-containing protein